MTTATQTLKNSATTAPKAVNAAPPEKLLPARGKLTAKLDQLERAMGDLADYTARAERAGVDENRAMEDETLSESEALEAIQTSQLQKSVFKARITNREKSITNLSGELATAIREGTNELRGLTNAETAKREKIIGDRVIAALGMGNAIDPRLMARELAEILRFSEAIQLVRALAPSTEVVQVGNTENLVSLAKDILSKFERVIVEAGREI
jgi:hypothetical protein